MKIREAWRLSKFPYVEVAFRSIQLSRGGTFRSRGFGWQDPQRAVRSTLTNVLVSKIIFSVFVCIGCALPFISLILDRSPVSLVGAISVALAISLTYAILYSLQVLPSLSGAGPYSLLRTLPLSEEDLSRVTMLSFIRTFDLPAMTAILVPVVIIAAATRSPVATALMFIGAVVNMVFALGISLWFSGVFYRNITRGGRSRSASILRGVFLITWGIAVLSIYVAFNFLTRLLPYVDSIISGNLSQPTGVLLILLHPFAIGLTIASTVFPDLFTNTSLPGGTLSVTALNYAASTLYVALAVVVTRWMLHALSMIASGERVSLIREAVKDFSLRLRRPLFAYVSKDLRVASKNPSTAMVFALPIFMLLIIYFSFSGTLNGFGIIETISATVLGAFFTLTGAMALLTTERSGLDFTLSMPIRSQMIIRAKSLVSTLIYLPVPFMVLTLILANHSSDGLAHVAIPLLEILGVSAATTAMIAVFIKTEVRSSKSSPMSGGDQATGFSVMSASNILTLLGAFVMAFALLIAPIVSYSVIFVTTSSNVQSLIGMTIAAVVELLIVQTIVRILR